jgi:hypothetical protein
MRPAGRMVRVLFFLKDSAVECAERGANMKKARRSEPDLLPKMRMKNCSERSSGDVLPHLISLRCECNHIK